MREIGRPETLYLTSPFFFFLFSSFLVYVFVQLDFFFSKSKLGWILPGKLADVTGSSFSGNLAG